MRFLKRFCCIALSIIILSLSIGTKYFDSNHMENVEATAETVAVGLSAAAMYAICFYVGTMMYANAPIEMNSLSDDQIAAMGHSTISYIYTTEALNSSLLGPSFVENPVMFGFVDKLGQSYVFGSNAVKEVAETSFQVIQGGKMPDDDDDDEGGIIDNLIKFPGNVKNLSACCSTGFAALLGSIIREQYDKYQNGDESIYNSEIEVQSFTDNDFINQTSGQSYTVKGLFGATEYFTNANWYYEISTDVNKPLALYYFMKEINGKLWPCYKVYCASSSTGIGITNISTHMLQCDKKDGHIIYQSTYGENSFQCCNIVSINLPVFSSLEACESYLLNNGEGAENALNYAKSYRIADWEQEDWAGILKDPLTGLTALGNLANIARHQGLNALGNEIDTDAFNDYLRDFFANTDPDEFPLPSPDPLKVPILWPTGALDPETSIDPSRNPAILPDPNIKPDPDPGTKPDPDPGIKPDPGVDPDPGTDPKPDVEELPAEELVPSITDSFGDLNIDLRNKFPFCIPWDLYYLLNFLSGLSDDSGISTYSDDHGGGGFSRDPTEGSGTGGGGHSREPVEKKNGAPVFRLPIVIERYGIEEYIIVDLSPFDALSKISRLLFTLMFVYTLINWTVKIVSVRKDD